MQFVYLGLFDPPHLGHVHRIAAVQQRLQPSTTLLVPLDHYDGEIPGRRIVRTKLVAALAESTDTVYSDAGLAVRDLQALVARLASREKAGTVVLFDPELPPGQQADDIHASRAGVEILADAVLGLPDGLPKRSTVHSAIRYDKPDWPTKLVAGVESMVKLFELYGWTRPEERHLRFGHA